MDKYRSFDLPSTRLGCSVCHGGDNLLLYGGEVYYKILDEAIENGFNDKKLH
mgnify:CR=1 FL=1